MKKIFNQETILYLIFGILTTMVYFITRFTVLNITNSSISGVVFGQISAILFAYITNKIFVFKDTEWSPRVVIKQLIGFIAGRLFVFILDIGITYLAVEKFSEFFINILFLNRINYNSLLFNNYFSEKLIGNPELLNEFIFALIVQVLAIVINYIISKKAVFKKRSI
ncbi:MULTISPECIES: GtrA family protein [Vagococcus]|uniref:GtrA family protein n=1 Tax=Vagococcus fluvialis bH819 TaxID=1255619 RepID=A0A1X6WPW4_9ENTE|nr:MULTISPECIES: GtrA family protein [Vagococcus]SLM86310.1 GtrA family protein [Vagococcus fluvialis bH819]HCM88962.1 GtrA family protein [Vagococcus sp.]